MRSSIVIIGAGLLLSVSFGACALQTKTDEPGALQPQSRFSDGEEDRRLLSGEWEYEEGTVLMTLALDDHGNGTYAWKGGSLKTVQLTGDTWVGTWHQTENDREGGFEVKLSEDMKQGNGRWWYTRIGSDRDPPDKGGSFLLSRVQGPSRTRSAPSMADLEPSPQGY
jgi:hypothetical protein